MHDIKYFFSIIRQSSGQKKISEGKITENITEKHYFSKSREALAPWPMLDPPLKIYVVNLSEVSCRLQLVAILAYWCVRKKKIKDESLEAKK
jgi:hypothetical protein